MRPPKRPKKFASADHKRQWEQETAAWQALNSKWLNTKTKSKVPDKPAKKVGKKTARVIIDPLVAQRLKESRAVKSKPDSVKGAVALKRSVMDPRSLAEEPPEVTQQTLAKSKSVMPIYNKGADQYVTNLEETLKTEGAKTRRPQ